LWFTEIAHGQLRYLTPVKKGEKWGFQDAKKQIVIQPQFDHVCSGPVLVHEGDLIPVGMGSKWGYADSYGIQVIEPQFDFAYPFFEGLAAVNVGGLSEEECLVKGGKWGYVDKLGKIVIQPAFDWTFAYTDGLAAVKIGEKWGYADRNGKIVIAATYDGAGIFREGLAAVQIGEKWGYVSNKGSTAIDVQFDGADNFSEGLAAVEVGEDWGYVNKAGEMVIKPQFNVAYGFDQGQASVLSSGGNLGLIDRTGASNESWEYLGTSEEDNFYYFDPKQVTHPSKNITRGWIKSLSEKSRSILFLEEVDCPAKKVHAISRVIYDEHGKLAATDSSAHDWDYIVPGSMGEAFHKALCRPAVQPPTKKKQRSKE
jgi:hypothetical protein